jgi:RimJ/RimL family protein N-acetyltransferase
MSDISDNVKLFMVTKDDIKFLYHLVQERSKYPEDYKTPASELPNYLQHTDFVNSFLKNKKSHSYLAWYVIVLRNDDAQNEKVGAIPLKKNGEWGFHILMNHWGKGIGTISAKKLFALHPTVKFWGRCMARNKRSAHMFEKLGFTLTELTFKKIN